MRGRKNIFENNTWIIFNHKFFFYNLNYYFILKRYFFMDSVECFHKKIYSIFLVFLLVVRGFSDYLYPVIQVCSFFFHNWIKELYKNKCIECKTAYMFDNLDLFQQILAFSSFFIISLVKERKAFS